MNAPLISVVVCTFRRPELIEKFLPSVCAQKLDGATFEVIVIDNNSRDRTPDVVAGLRRTFGHLRYGFEAEQGLSHARNRGWQESRGEYVAYLDDDCRVPPGWLAVAQEVIEQQAPVEFGGPIVGFYEGKKPRWWRTGYDVDHSHHYAECEGHLAPHQEIYGGNLFLLRRAIETVGGFDPCLGMRGNRLGYGEEWDLHLRLARAIPGHLAYFQPRLYVEHLVRAEKLSLLWRFREQISRGRFTHLIACNGQPLYGLRQSVGLPARVAGKFIRAGLHAGWRRDREAYPCWQNYFYENIALRIACNQLGQLQAQWTAAPRWRRREDPGQACACRLGTGIPAAGDSGT